MLDHCTASEFLHFVILIQKLRWSNIKSPRMAGFLINIFLVIPNSSILVPELRCPPPPGLFRLLLSRNEGGLSKQSPLVHRSLHLAPNSA